MKNAPILNLGFNPTSHLLTSSGESTHLVLWKVRVNSFLKPYIEYSGSLYGHRGAVLKFNYNPNGSLLGSCGEYGEIIIWDTYTWKERRRFKANNAWVRAIDINDKGQVVTGGEDNIVRLWDIHSTEYKEVGSHKDWVRDVIFYPNDNYILSAGDDKCIRVWDYESYIEVGVLEGHKDNVSSMWLDSTGTLLVSCGWDEEVNIWDISNGELLTTLKDSHVKSETSECLNTVIVTKDVRYLLTGSDLSSINIWDLNKEQIIHRINTDQYSINSLLLAPDNDSILFSAGEDGSIKIYDISFLYQ